jgi:hypothetical protein
MDAYISVPTFCLLFSKFQDMLVMLHRMRVQAYLTMRRLMVDIEWVDQQLTKLMERSPKVKLYLTQTMAVTSAQLPILREERHSLHVVHVSLGHSRDDKSDEPEWPGDVDYQTGAA